MISESLNENGALKSAPVSKLRKHLKQYYGPAEARP
jgi:hypothetical protein